MNDACYHNSSRSSMNRKTGPKYEDSIVFFFQQALTIALVFACLSFAVSAAEPPVISTKIGATVITAEGRVEARKKGEEAWKAVKTNQFYYGNDWIRTGLKSRAVLRFSDQSLLRLNQMATIEIQPPNAQQSKTVLDLKSGSTYFYNREQPAEVQFRTPVASGAIRGTEFNLSVDDQGRTLVSMLDGEVDIHNEKGDKTVGRGEQGIVDPGQAPRKVAMLDAINIIQWALYYPAVLSLADLDLKVSESAAIQASLASYRSGDLLSAAHLFPINHAPASAEETVYLAALQLAVGQVDECEKLLHRIEEELKRDTKLSVLAESLRELMAAVKNQPFRRGNPPVLSTEWLADSYWLQSNLKLEEALKAAQKATVLSPEFGFAWVRLAELEFGFGRVPQAEQALAKGINYSPKNAQAIALKGFLATARNKTSEALACFNQSIQIDSALGNAWLGRGLCQMRLGEMKEGLDDLQTAATLEPQRAMLRSYLAKANQVAKDPKRAWKELNLARRMDPRDPTAWLYSALLLLQENRLNDAISDLEKSSQLNDNRQIYRSRMMLDQDKAVRGVNLASMYRDVKMTDWSVNQAMRAVDDDYVNASAHLFLANSYDAQRDPRQRNLRYETPWYSELLLANLLAPVGTMPLSQNVSLNEYSSLFERDHAGINALTEYYSSGAWVERTSQYGNYNNSAYAIDFQYNIDPGQRANNDLYAMTWNAKAQQQLTPQDSILFQATYYESESGDVGQYYDQNAASKTLRYKEWQDPTCSVGYHHQWSPEHHTLLLAGGIREEKEIIDPRQPALTVTLTPTGPIKPQTFYASKNFRNEPEVYFSELQHLWKMDSHNTILGLRYQYGTTDVESHQKKTGLPPFFSDQFDDSRFQRFSAYGYHQWDIVPEFQITGGLCYDRMRYAQNEDVPPVSNQAVEVDHWGPKAGMRWTITTNTFLHGAYTRSLGGQYNDESFRLEPSQVSGFNQAFRSIIPESVAGIIPGAKFETGGIGLDHEFPTRTYLTLEGQWLRSEGALTSGAFIFGKPNLWVQIPKTMDYVEKSLLFTVNQLLSQEWSLGVRYRLTHADMEILSMGNVSNQSALLHQATPYILFQHPCGFFSEANSTWTAQSNYGYTTDIPGDDFWQFNLYAGYRFLGRRAEVRLGLLNLADQDYQLNPLTLYSEMPRERTFMASLKISF